MHYAAPPAQAAHYYASPSGSAGGNGSASRPWNLETALSKKYGDAKAGDTVWLKEGTYRGNFVSTLQGSQGAPVVVRAEPGERVTIDGTLLQAGGGYVTYWGFEIMRSYTDHTSGQSGSAPHDLPVIMGMNLKAPGIKLVNMIVHDQISNGVGLWEEAPNSEIYGCIFFNNGWDGTDRGHGHGMYVQNETGTKRILDNISFNNYSDGLQIYGTKAAHLNNITVEGNVLFNAGSISRWAGANDLQLGGANPAHGIVVRNNFTYSSDAKGHFNLGSDAHNVDLRLENNIIVGTLQLQNWRSISLRNNQVVGRSTFLQLVQRYSGLGSSDFSWDQNRYYSQELDWQPFSLVTSSSRAIQFPQWKNLTGLDRNSTYTKGKPSGVQVYVRRNAYEAGRGHVVVYNWDRRSQVAVDAGGILASGARFEVRNAQNFFAAPVLSGTYRGQDLVLPTTGLSVARPVGKSTAPPAAGPEFNVFVILPLGDGSTTPPSSEPPPASEAPPSTPPAPSSSGQTFTQSESISLPDLGRASVYPSNLRVTGLSGVVRNVTVTLLSLTHTFPDDLDFLLVSPSGEKVLLMSDTGGDEPVSSIDLVLSGDGKVLPDYARLASGTYRPANYGSGDAFAAPAPAGPYATSLSAFRGASPNGTWSLYILDDERADVGRLAGGWRLTLETGSSAGVQSLESEPSITQEDPGFSSSGAAYDAANQPTLAAIRSVRRDENGLAVLLVNWTPGQTYTVEVSSDHLTWTALATVVATAKSQEYADLEASPHALRFYRIRQEPGEAWQQKESQPEAVSAP